MQNGIFNFQDMAVLPYFVRALYSNSAKNFKRPNTREDSSDLDKKNTVFIAAMRSTSGNIFYRHPDSKNMVSIFFFAKNCLNKVPCIVFQGDRAEHP